MLDKSASCLRKTYRTEFSWDFLRFSSLICSFYVSKLNSLFFRKVTYGLMGERFHMYCNAVTNSTSFYNLICVREGNAVMLVMAERPAI